MWSAEYESPSERWPSEPIQRCVEIYERRTGNTVTPPDEVKPREDGKREQLFVSVMESCNDLELFKAIAEKAGADLTNETWTEAVDNYGPIDLVVTEFASFGEGKYDGQDGFRLVQFDSTLGFTGDWAPRGELTNTAED
jgi:hypothetical protein